MEQRVLHAIKVSKLIAVDEETALDKAGMYGSFETSSQSAVSWMFYQRPISDFVKHSLVSEENQQGVWLIYGTLNPNKELYLV